MSFDKAPDITEFDMSPGTYFPDPRVPLLLSKLETYFQEIRDKYKLGDNSKFGVDILNQIETIAKNLRNDFPA